MLKGFHQGEKVIVFWCLENFYKNLICVYGDNIVRFVFLDTKS